MKYLAVGLDKFNTGLVILRDSYYVYAFFLSSEVIMVAAIVLAVEFAVSAPAAVAFVAVDCNLNLSFYL